MPPIDSSESNLFSLFNWFAYKVKQWLRQEIVDDDPWDRETLFPDSQTDRSFEPSESAHSSKPPQ